MGWGIGNIVKTVATGGLNKVAANKSVTKAVDKITKPVGSKVTAVAKQMRLPSIAANLNIKQAITNPVAYVKSNAAAYAKDATVAAAIYGNLKKGNVKGLVMQGLNDTKAAATAAKTGKVQAVDWKLDAPKLPDLIPAQPSFSQLTNDAPLYPMSEPIAAPQTYVAMEPEQQASKKPLLIVGALAAVVMLMVLVK